ncbi:MAG: hypothetical protein JWQ09_1477 [Segetibacter sp.]|nr:hypothetical protein [Segetibacter sp.]
MVQSIVEQSYQLTSLITSLPCENSYRSSSELNGILNKYLRILDYVNSYNQEYKSATRVFYADITTIRDNIHQLLIADSPQEKDKAFENAKNELKTDLHALAILIKPQEELAG